MGKIDLHLHSTASDGRYSPEEVVHKAARAGLVTICLADHDSIEGIPAALAAAKAYPGLTVIPGIEVSTELAGGEAHILSYYVDHTNQELQTALRRFRESRLGRARGMVAKLGELGVDITWERVQEIAGDGSVGRPHIALAMLEKGYIEAFPEAFTRYIGNSGPAYVEREKMTPAAAVELIVRTGGLPGLAHPYTVPDPKQLVAELKLVGLAAIEVYYKDYTNQQVGELREIAAHHRLVATGGTDYHGNDEVNEVRMGSVRVPPASVEKLLTLARARGCPAALTA